jgi:hypothetical protein
MWGKKRAEEKIECSLVKGKDIYLEPIVRQKIEILMAEYRSQEWLGYLTGELKEEKVFCNDLVIPPHTSVTGGCAEAEPFCQPKDCVGVIHSHHTMGAFHSSTDQDYVDKNFPVSITVASNKAELTYDAVCYTRTPCGKSISATAKVFYVQPEFNFDRKAWLEEAKTNIEKGKRVGINTPLNCYETYVPNWYKDKVEHKKNSRKEEPYIPFRYREQPVVLGDGRVLSRREWEDIMNNSD